MQQLVMSDKVAKLKLRKTMLDVVADIVTWQTNDGSAIEIIVLVVPLVVSIDANDDYFVCLRDEWNLPLVYVNHCVCRDD